MDEAQRTAEFLLPVLLGDEVATAQERSRARRTGIYDVEVRDRQGDCVALLRCSSHQLGGSVIEHAASVPGSGGG